MTAEMPAHWPEIDIDGQTFHRVEGDLLLDSDELEIYKETLRIQREAARLMERNGFGAIATAGDMAGPPTTALVGILDEDGKILRWDPGTVLRYCVLKRTFPEEEKYRQVAENMRKATDDWSTTCDVHFEHVTAADDSDSLRPPGVVFPVRHIDAQGSFIAAAFFPNDPPDRRRVFIDPSYFDTGFDRVGVLRHELGHVLGFRHEHIRSGAPAVCPDESTTGTVNLTDYDPHSVMHYFCGDVGSRDLAITDTDRIGSQKVYGPPLSAFRLQAA